MSKFTIGDKVNINNFIGTGDTGGIVGVPLIMKCANVCVELEDNKNPSSFKFWCMKLDSTGETQNLCEEHLTKK